MKHQQSFIWLEASGSPRPMERVRWWLYPYSLFTAVKQSSLRMSSALASNPSSRRALGRFGILGWGEFRCKLDTFL